MSSIIKIMVTEHYRKIAVWVVVLCLCGCSGSDKKPLKGQRIPVMLTEQEILPDPEISKKPLAPVHAEHNGSWPQPGGVAAHNMPPVSVRSDMKPVWSRSVGQGYLTCGPVLAEGTLFLLNARGQVVALNAETGKSLWTTSLIPQGFKDSSFEDGGVTYDQGQLYVTTGWGEVLCLNPKDGQTVWRHMLGTPVHSAPTAHNGRVFVVTTHNELWTFQAATGDVLWSHAGIPEIAFLEGGASPAVRSDLLVAAYTSGEAYALQPENGYPLWSDTLTSARSIDSISNIVHIRAHPVIVGNTVLLISHGGRARAVNALNGETVWELSIGGIQTPSVFDDHAAFVTSDAHCVCVHVPTGKVRWITPLITADDSKTTATWVGPLWTNSGLLCLGSQGRMVWIDPARGTLREGAQHKASFSVPPIVADDTLYTLDERGTITAWK